MSNTFTLFRGAVKIAHIKLSRGNRERDLFHLIKDVVKSLILIKDIKRSISLNLIEDKGKMINLKFIKDKRETLIRLKVRAR